MSSRPLRTPKYRHYQPKDLAVVRIDGTDHYLGRYGTPESWEKYHRLIAEWLTTRRSLSQARRAAGPEASNGLLGISVNELILAYWRHAQAYYVKHGRPTDEQAGIRSALRFVRRLYGSSRCLTKSNDRADMRLPAATPRDTTMTENRSEKHEQARNSLPEELRPTLDDFVADYKFHATKRHGAPYVSYIVLADMVRAGWRLAADPLSEQEGQGKRRLPAAAGDELPGHWAFQEFRVSPISGCLQSMR